MMIERRSIRLKDGRGLVLRSPAPEDAEVFLSHMQRVFAESYRNLNQPPGHWEQFTAQDERTVLEGFRDSPSKFMIAAFAGDGRVVGNIGIFGQISAFDRHSARLGMGIEKEFCEAGLGTALILEGIAVSKRAGFERLELNVRTFNEMGIRLYEKAGFRKAGTLHRVAKIDGEYFDEHIYELLLV